MKVLIVAVACAFLAGYAVALDNWRGFAACVIGGFGGVFVMSLSLDDDEATDDGR